MKVTILCHELSSNAVMRAHRLAQAARTFAEVKLIGSVSRKGAWPALPQEPWIRPVRKRLIALFYASLLALGAAAGRDALSVGEPFLVSLCVGPGAAGRRHVSALLQLH